MSFICNPPVLGEAPYVITQVLQEDKFGSVSIGQRPDGSRVIVEAGHPAEMRRKLQKTYVDNSTSFTLPILSDSPELDYVVTGPLRKSVLQTMKELGLPKLTPVVALTTILQLSYGIMDLHAKGFVGLGISPERIVKCPFTVGEVIRVFPLCFQDLRHAERHDSKSLIYANSTNSCWDLMFCSVRSHHSQTPSMADDWESLIYTLLYLTEGKLPWQHMSSSSEIMQAKLAVNELSFEKGLGRAYEFLRDVRGFKPGQVLDFSNLDFSNLDFDPPQPKLLRVGEIVGLHWTVEKLLGFGAHSVVYRARNSEGLVVALKCVQLRISLLHLVSEAHGYRKLLAHGVPGVPKIFTGEEEAQFQGLMALEMKGPSLFDIAQKRGDLFFKIATEYDAFKLETLVYIGHKLLDIIEVVHKVGLVHGDIKPSNLVMGLPNNPEACQLFLIDFCRLAHTSEYKYVHPHETEAPTDKRPARDLESLIYTLIDLGLSKSFPWQRSDPLIKIFDMKLRLTEEDLHPLPRQFLDLLHMSRWAAKGDGEIEYRKFHNLLDEALGGRKVPECPLELTELSSSHNLDPARFAQTGIPTPDRSGIDMIWIEKHKMINVSVYLGQSAVTFSYLSRLECKGVPNLVARGLHPFYHFIVVSQHHQTSLAVLLGESCGIDLTQLVKIGYQLVNNLKSLHKVGYVAGLFSPWDLMWEQDRLYFSNFRHMHRYVRPTSVEHLAFEKIKIQDMADERFTNFGSVFFYHYHMQPSRKGDMESAVYILIYLASSTLPWMNLTDIDEILHEKLQYSETKFDPLPPCFFELWKYVRELGHEEEPNYEIFHNFLEQL